GSWISQRSDQQSHQFKNWLANLIDHQVKLVLLELGILEEKTRPSVTKGTKQFKALTEHCSGALPLKTI
ncbi:MAG: hypothetical protein BWK79_06520, partial [Beggiatoa sp. IS2]